LTLNRADPAASSETRC
ncbi:hypothetical protein PG991_001493, partial [Apiospora marii]